MDKVESQMVLGIRLWVKDVLLIYAVHRYCKILRSRLPADRRSPGDDEMPVLLTAAGKNGLHKTTHRE
jgi:hypothetical protein